MIFAISLGAIVLAVSAALVRQFVNPRSVTKGRMSDEWTSWGGKR
mgnify:CR=1 FL=1